MTVTNVGKLFHKAVASKYIEEHIHVKNSMNIINVLTPFYITVLFKSIKNMAWSEVL